ncbi:MAG: hypothetical protein ACI4AD_01315 [Roseburia sp.]
MAAYSKAYLDEVTENQGKLFDYVASNYPDMDTEDFIYSYMKSNTRKYVDEAQAFVCTMDAKDLWEYFRKTDRYELKKGTALKGFLPDWIGEFYAYYQWKYGISSRRLIDKVPLDYLKKAYAGLHDLDLELAVKKVGEI